MPLGLLGNLNVDAIGRSIGLIPLTVAAGRWKMPDACLGPSNCDKHTLSDKKPALKFVPHSPCQEVFPDLKLSRGGALVKKTLLALLFAGTSISIASAQSPKVSAAPTARQAAAEMGWKGTTTNPPVKLAPPHACTISPAHPCVFYGGDLNLNFSANNGLSNENSAFIPLSFTYGEVNSPVSASITASFTNNLMSFGVLDPKTATWDWRTGVSEGNGGTSIGSGDSTGQITDTHRNNFGFEEFEVLTKTAVHVATGNNWFTVLPDCTNSGDGDCTSGRSFESTTDGTLNAINGSFQVGGLDGQLSRGPIFNSAFFGANYQTWCVDQLPGFCPTSGQGMGVSSGVLK